MCFLTKSVVFDSFVKLWCFRIQILSKACKAAHVSVNCEYKTCSDSDLQLTRVAGIVANFSSIYNHRIDCHISAGQTPRANNGIHSKFVGTTAVSLFVLTVTYCGSLVQLDVTHSLISLWLSFKGSTSYRHNKEKTEFL